MGENFNSREKLFYLRITDNNLKTEGLSGTKK
jgi:hypothetical protein